MAGVAGFEPANMGLKIPCLRPLGDTLLLPVFPGCQSAYIPEELVRGIGYIHPTTPLPDAEVSFHRGKSSDGGHGAAWSNRTTSGQLLVAALYQMPRVATLTQ